jgi:uncharacterized protein YbjT (DUF2867 family)
MILVTGATGNVGSEVVKALSGRGERFRAAYTSKEKAAKAKTANVDPVVLDFAKPETFGPALAGVDRLFLVTSDTSPEPALVKAAKAAGVRHLVKLSVFDAPGEGFMFGRAHRAVEKEIEASGLSYTFLRPNGFMQNMANQQAGAIKASGVFHFPAAETRISHVDTRDIARVAATVLTSGGHEGKAYELTGPEGLTYGQIAAEIGRAIGKPVAYVAVSDEDFRKAMAGMGAPAPFVDALSDLFRFYRTGAASRVSTDIEKVTGRRASSFSEWARDHAVSFR